MISGMTDRPKVGHILRYVYLFAQEAAAGREAGAKERFVVVVGIGDQDGRYRVAAITTKGEGKDKTVALPKPVATAAGLSPESSVVVDEMNVLTWPGYDIRPLMDTAGHVVGRMCPGFTSIIISEILARRVSKIDRD